MALAKAPRHKLFDFPHVALVNLDLDFPTEYEYGSIVGEKNKYTHTERVLGKAYKHLNLK